MVNDDTSPNVLFKSGGDEKGYIRTMMPFESLQLNGKRGLVLNTAGNPAMSISDGGIISFPEFGKWSTTSATGNLHISESGQLYKSTVSMYSAEEVDKKLAVKDKIIEKLEARLTKLEARNK